MIDRNLFKKAIFFQDKEGIITQKDQNFLVDKVILDDFIKSINIKPTERIIEVGTGLGFLTEKIAYLCKELISIEIDERFKKYLPKFPKNVKIIFADAYKLFCDKNFTLNIGKIDKIIGNFPYSQLENFLHPLMKGGWFHNDLFIIGPASFVNTVNKNPIFNSYFNAFLIKKIAKTSFYPQPKTVSGIIHLKRRINPLKDKDFSIYLKRFLYEHEHYKLKNGLREAIISLGKDLKNIFISKNQARLLVKKLYLPKNLLERYISQLNLKTFVQISNQITNIINSYGGGDSTP